MCGIDEVNFFRWARNGGEASKELVKSLVVQGVQFKNCTYSDAREEWTILLEYDKCEFIMHASSTIDIAPRALSYIESIGHWGSWWNVPTVETLVYQLTGILNGYRFDRSLVVDGLKIEYCKLPPWLEVLGEVQR